MSNSHKPHRRPSLFWPLFLIAIGSILLLSNLGILPSNSIDLLWRFWPLVLVIIGLDILLGRRSAVGSIITSMVAILLLGGALAFIFFAQNIPELVEEIDLGNLNHSIIKEPLGEVESAEVFIDWSDGPSKLSALVDSNNLVEGELYYYGRLHLDLKTRHKGSHADVKIDTRREGFFISSRRFEGEEATWEIGLHPKVKLDLTLDANSGPGEYDLRDLTIERFNIDASSGPLTIFLPTSGRLEGVIDGGSGPIDLILPRGMEVKITVEKGTGPFQADSRFSRRTADDSDTTIWLTEGFQGADNYIELEIDQGIGPIQIR